MKGEDPIRSAVAGLADAAMEFAAEKAATFVQKLLDHRIAFVQSTANIQLVREQRKKPEWQLYQDYVTDKRLRILIEMGMALRELETDPVNSSRIKSLRERIRSKFGAEGLHIAQVVQTGLLFEVFSRAVERSPNRESIRTFIEATLDEAENYCVFIQEEDEPKRKAEEIINRLDANQPRFLYLLSKGKAKDVLYDVVKRVHGRNLDYEWSKKEDKYSLFYILSKRP